jgi:IS605 OrfB family transposase
MIKSTKTTLKFSNKKKINDIHLFIDEYRRVVGLFVDILWEMERIPSLLPKNITEKINSWLSARALQCAGKQASAIVNGTKSKECKRTFIINKLNNEGKFKKARKLKAINDKLKSSKPNINEVEPVLDSRFVKIDTKNDTIFDGWVTLSSLGNKIKIKIPFKYHKHYNKLKSNGNLKQTIQISKKNITFLFDIPEPKKITNGITLGIDVGQKDALTISNGQTISEDNHKHTYQSICDQLARKKKGSKSFDKKTKHRSNYLRWVINQIDLNDVNVIRRENIKNIRKNKRINRKLSHWNYRELFDVLDSKLNDLGVQVVKLSPTYTSQRCFSCGWVRKSNRKGKQFKCNSCGHTDDADLNAAKNIALELPVITKQQRLKQLNKKGFFWVEDCKEYIVPYA